MLDHGPFSSALIAASTPRATSIMSNVVNNSLPGAPCMKQGLAMMIGKSCSLSGCLWCGSTTVGARTLAEARVSLECGLLRRTRTKGPALDLRFPLLLTPELGQGGRQARLPHHEVACRVLSSGPHQSERLCATRSTMTSTMVSSRRSFSQCTFELVQDHARARVQPIHVNLRIASARYPQVITTSACSLSASKSIFTETVTQQECQKGERVTSDLCIMIITAH